MKSPLTNCDAKQQIGAGGVELHVSVHKCQVPKENLTRVANELGEGGRVRSFLKLAKGFVGSNTWQSHDPESFLFIITVWKNKEAYSEFELVHGSTFNSLLREHADWHTSAHRIDLNKLVL